ncbi:DNA-dependent protein kinase subunit [Tieghemostelium lacteum]|uniref:DNA-dependent protein kinase catalytic subunit n=1 Tax=Tieghemostelium lacteum TaxID=361077 RepID=A0A151ZCC3_TIELA|nr:DNA-dependent protein kinase subunit [Tieghemostelium lacteum]|eukprot:KYQ91591.1 DNA-dependent protein kinase subunit [Tieghemostelium lacteum]
MSFMSFTSQNSSLNSTTYSNEISGSESTIYKKIEKYLVKLFESVDRNKSSGLESDILLLDELSNIVLKELVHEEIGMASSLLFQSEYNLLKYLDKTVLLNSKEIVKLKSNVLNLITEFIAILKSQVVDYILSIKNICVAVFRKDQSATVQALSFLPIKKIIHLMGSKSMQRSEAEAEKDNLAYSETMGVKEMTDLFLLQFTCGKLSQSVKGEIIETLGLFTEYFSGKMFDKNQQLSSIFMETLGSQLKSKSPETKLLLSCLKALNSLLVHFSGDFVQNTKNIHLLYQYVYVCMDPQSSNQRFEIPRAAMKVIFKHSTVFKQYLTEQSEKFFERLEYWCKHGNKQNRDIAFNTVDVFLSQIAKELTSGNRNLEADQATFKYFIRKFYSIFENNQSTGFEISIAIRGCGRFASPVKSFLGEYELKSLLSSFIKFSEKLMVVKIENIEEIALHLSSFINAFASILFELSELEFWYLDHLETILEIYFIIYPHLFPKSRDRYFKAVNRLITSLYFRGEYLKILLSRFVKKSLIITFSKPNPLVQHLITTGDQPYYDVYKEVWYQLLNPSIEHLDLINNSNYQQKKQDNNNNNNNNNKSTHSISSPEEICKSIRKYIYDEMISSIILIINKLDLNYTSKPVQSNTTPSTSPTITSANNNNNNNVQQQQQQQQQGHTDNNSDNNNNSINVINYENEVDKLVPITPKDIEVFLNLVEFFKVFLAKYHCNLFNQWVYIFTKEIIYYSKKYPLISGFYKLVQVVMKICRYQKYFDFIDQDRGLLSHQDSKDDLMLTDEQENKINCFIMFKKFLKEVSGFVSHYKDELLSSCIQLLLSIPKQLLNIPILIPVLNLSLKMGLSYLKLGHIALNAIEYWLEEVPHQVSDHLQDILPNLNDYLLISYQAFNSDQHMSVNSIETSEILKQTFHSNRKKFTSKTLDPKLLQFRSSIVTIQNRIIRLLGRLGGKNYHFLGETNLLAPGTESGTVWDTESRIKFSVAFIDQKVDIYLDSILPGVVNLAERSTSRQTKVAACEFLHSLLLFMIGNSSRDDTISFTKIYRRLFPSLLRLSTDVEQITKQLFQPLTFQLIHWFTKNKKQESDDTMTLLNAIVDAVGHNVDGALRDFSGKCLAEFARWSIKNVSQKQQDKNPFNFKSILKRVYSLAHHPNPYKRLGAAISFTELHRILREEDALINQFIFEIIHNILFSLRITDENDEDSVEIASKYSVILQSMIKVIQRKSDLLNTPNEKRREHPDLSSFVWWLFKENCGRHEKLARYESMILFVQLVPCISSGLTPSQWLKDRVKSEGGISFLVAIAEPTISLKIPKLETKSLKDIEFWFKRLQTTVNFYTWVFSESLVDPDQLFSQKESKIMNNGFHVFTQEFAMINQQSSLFQSMTPKEVDKFNQLKCSVIMNLFGLFIILVEKYKYQQLMSYIGTGFFRLLVTSLMDCQSIGFMSFLEQQEDREKLLRGKSEFKILLDKSFRFPPLIDVCTHMVVLVLQQGVKYRETLFQILLEFCQQKPYNLFNLGDLIQSEGTDRLLNLIKAYNSLQTHGSGLLQDILKQQSQSLRSLSEYLLDYLYSHCENLSPSKLLISKHIIQFLFNLNEIKPNELLELIITDHAPPTPTDDQQQQQQQVITNVHDQKDIFYKTFLFEINTFISRNFSSYLPFLAKRILASNHIHKLFNDICLHIQSQKSEQLQSTTKKEMLSVLAFLEKISEWTLNVNLKNAEKENIVEFVKNLIKIDETLFFQSPIGNQFVFDLLKSYLNRNNSLGFKNKVLVLLPFVLGHLSSQQSQEIKEKLNEIVVYDFPMSSKDLTIRSPVYNEYISTVERFLETLEITKNPMMIDILLHILKEPDHHHIGYINLSLERLIKSSNDDQCKSIFSHCFQIFLSNDYQDELKLILVQKFCLPIIRQLQESSIVEIFVKHMSELMSIIQPLTQKYLSDSMERKSAIIEKIGCFYLIETLYQALPSQTIKDRINPLFYNKPDQKGTELTGAIMKAAHIAKSEKLTSDDKYVTRSLCTTYHGSAFSALAAVIISTQNKENFFHVFFFKENKEKNEFIWENIIDLTKTYKFEPETNFIVSYSTPQSLFANDLKYLSSQYFTDSSLSQDFINKSLPNVAASDGDQQSTDIAQGTGSMGSVGGDGNLQVPDSGMTTVDIGGSTSIEIDEVNSNPSMISMLKVIDVYQSKFVAPVQSKPNSLLDDEDDVNDMPKWMYEIYIKLKSLDLNPNIQIFIIKLIINRPRYFERFHRHWIPLIMEYVMSPNNGGSGFHYFVRDACMILLRWKNIFYETDRKPLSVASRDLVSKFMNFLFKNAYCNDRRILKSNLNIIKMFTERWKGLFQVDKSIIVDYLSQKGDYKSKARQIKTTGLVLLSVLLSNGIPAYDKDHDHTVVSEFKFYQLVLDNLQDFKELYDSASEVCGMILLFNHKHKIESDVFQKLLKERILLILANNENQRAFSCLYFIGLHYPQFIQHFFVKIFALLPQVTSESRLIALNIIFWCVDDIQDLYMKLQSCNLDNIIRIREGETQLTILKILYKLIKKKDTTLTTITQILQLLLSSQFSSNSNEICRLIFYEILIYLYHNYQDFQQDKNIVSSLLLGLSDENQTIHKKLLEFWDNNKILSLNTVTRLTVLFDQMYSPETESRWLGNSCSLLLQLCWRSTEFSKVLFDKPLSECHFKDVQVDSSWQNRTSNMNPLFSSSQLGTASDNDIVMSIDDFEIRATQTPQFTLTQSAFSEFYPSSMSIDPTNNNNNNNNSGGTSTAKQQRKSKAVDPMDARLGKYMEGRNRFKKVDEKSQKESISQFARFQVKKNKQRESLLEKSKKARENQITMFRKYRAGDLPDIQIKYQELMKPLQSLCNIDSSIGVYMFSSLFSSIYSQLPNRDQMQTFKNQLKDSIDSIIRQCKFNSSLISCLLNISEKNLEFSPTPSQISSISMKSNNHPMGIVLIEKLLLSIQNQKSSVGTNTTNTTPNMNEYWDNLRDLYKSIKEDDIILGLLEKQQQDLRKQASQNEQVVNYTKSALEYELKGDWLNVLSVYDIATSKLESGDIKDISESEVNLWENGRLESYMKLRNLTALRENFYSYFQEPLSIFDDQNKDTLINYFLQFNLKVKENWSQLYQFLSSLSPEQYQYLENHFPGEMAFVMVTRSYYNKSDYYIQKFYQNFKEQWSSSHPLAIASRHRILQPLQKVVEIEEFLSLISTENQKKANNKRKIISSNEGTALHMATTNKFTLLDDNFEEDTIQNAKRIDIVQLNQLLKSWKSRYPSKIDDIMVWDDVVSFRSVLLEKLYERFISQSSTMIEQENQIKTLLIQERAELYHQMSKGSLKLNNIVVSEYYFRLSVKSYPKTKDNDLAFPLVRSLIKIYCRKAKNSPNSLETLDRFVKALKFIESKKDEESILSSNENYQKYLQLHGDIYWEIYQLDKDLGSQTVSESIQKNQISSLSTGSGVNLKNELFSSTYKCYSESIQLHGKNQEKLSSSSSSSPLSALEKNSNVNKMKSAHLKFANFCDSILKQQTSTSGSSVHINTANIGNEQLARSIINSTLEAIREEIPGAIDKFPRLLEILTQYEKVIPDFKAKVLTIPSWMFIRWISQIFPYLDSPQLGPIIIQILLEIAKYYPQALYFPYKISSEQFGAVAKKIAKPLDDLLKHPLLDQLVEEFGRLTHPEHRFKDAMDQLKSLMKQTPLPHSEIIKEFNSIYNENFNPKTVQGEYNLKFAKEWETPFLNHFGRDASKLLKMDAKKLLETVAEMSGAMAKNMKPTSTASMKLKDFSQWLTEFDKSNHPLSMEMEIPGQYSGFSKPQPEQHIKISSFDATILVMGSLRKPKRIKIHGNDEKDYPFLIKGGEDLRLDQRIQQLFQIMNEILKRDPPASKRGLRVTTYQVVPMTSSVGIIEWLNDTKPVREIIEEQLAIQQKTARSQVSISRLEATKIHNEWINNFSKYLKVQNAPAGLLYQQMFIHSGRDEVAKKLDKQHSKIPGNLLQSGIWTLSSNPESYLFIRNSFARSLAAFCICSYVIGIGDRHLENFLISQRDGRLIGIDFGHAFGTATQFLPIPELMPFRLTRQFTSFLQPLDPVGLLSHNMTYTMSALQQHKDILLTTMDVFVKEPLLDWSKLASRLVKEQGKHPKDTKNEWFPKQKVSIAKKKLELYNPSAITLEELASSIHSGTAYEKPLEAIIKGDPRHNIRSKVGKVCNSVKQQVDCLIDQATDPNILSRSWVGWGGWI